MKRQHSLMSEKQLKELGKSLSNQVKNLRYFKWNNGTFEQIRELDPKGMRTKKYQVYRKRLDDEIKFTSNPRIWAYIAFITAPGPEAREKVITDCYLMRREKIKEQMTRMGQVTDPQGFDFTTPNKDIVQDYDNFHVEFEVICSELEKALINGPNILVSA